MKLRHLLARVVRGMCKHGRLRLAWALALAACAPVDAPPRAQAPPSRAEALCLDALAHGDPSASLSPDGDDAALAAALAAARQPPARFETRLALGRTWLRLVQARSHPGWLLQASACADAARALQSGEPAALELQAAVALAGHRFREAERLALDLLLAAPDHVAALGILSDARLELGDYVGAAESTRRQMDLWPGAAAQARAAWLHWLHGDIAAAKRALTAALRGRDASTPGFNAWLWSELAQLYWHEGDLAGADLFYRQALAQSPRFAPALLGRARIALARQQARSAVLRARAALAAGAGMEAAILLGDALAQRGDRHAAEAARQQAEDLGRRSDDFGLARFLSERGRNPALALQMLQRIHSERPAIQVEAALAWAQYRAGDCAAALSNSRRARRMGTREATLWEQGGQIELGCGDPGQGRALVAAAHRLAPATATEPPS